MTKARRGGGLLLAALGCLGGASASAQEAQGFAEVRAHYNLGVDGVPWELVERVRPSFYTAITERVVLSATVEATLHEGRDLQTEVARTLDESDLGPLLDLAGCEWPEEANEAFDINEASDYLSVDRLYLDTYLPFADVRVGRQAVNWGSALMVNPTDPFPEVLLTEPWKPRAGVNALRVTVPVGEFHQIQGVVGTNSALTKLRAAVRGTVNLGLTDVSVVGAYRQESEDGIVGMDVRGTLGVGFWAEGAAHLRTQDKGGPYEEIALGIDYSFPVLNTLVVSGQYYHNGAGALEQTTPSAAAAFTAIEPPSCAGVDLFGAGDADAAAADPFAPFFSGTDYTMLSVALGVNESINVSGLWVQNLGDGSALAVPVVSMAPNGWLEVSASAQIPFSTWGDGGELHPSEDDLMLSFDTGGAPLTVDLSGLAADATFIVWTRVNF